jgi:hypothetical protein
MDDKKELKPFTTADIEMLLREILNLSSCFIEKTQSKFNGVDFRYNQE